MDEIMSGLRLSILYVLPSEYLNPSWTKHNHFLLLFWAYFLCILYSLHLYGFYLVTQMLLY